MENWKPESNMMSDARKRFIFVTMLEIMFVWVESLNFRTLLIRKLLHKVGDVRRHSKSNRSAKTKRGIAKVLAAESSGCEDWWEGGMPNGPTTSTTIIFIEPDYSSWCVIACIGLLPTAVGDLFKKHHDWISPLPETQPYDVRTPHFVELWHER